MRRPLRTAQGADNGGAPTLRQDGRPVARVTPPAPTSPGGDGRRPRAGTPNGPWQPCVAATVTNPPTFLPVTAPPPLVPPSAADSDSRLVRLAIAGDEGAMRLLWERHRGHVNAVVGRLVDDPDQAADVAQEVWVQLFRALPSWREDARFATWLHRVAVNRTLNALRAHRRAHRYEAPLDVTAWEAGATAVEAAPVSEAERALTAGAIAAAARQLAPGARQVFYLHDVEGYTHEEIAASLGITSGGSKSQLFKARAKLRRLLAPLVDGGVPARGAAAAPAPAARSASIVSPLLQAAPGV